MHKALCLLATESSVIQVNVMIANAPTDFWLESMNVMFSNNVRFFRESTKAKRNEETDLLFHIPFSQTCSRVCIVSLCTSHLKFLSAALKITLLKMYQTVPNVRRPLKTKATRFFKSNAATVIPKTSALA